MKTSRPMPTWLKWLCRIFGILFLLGTLFVIPGVIIATVFVVKALQANKTTPAILGALTGDYVALFVMAWLGILLTRKGWKKNQSEDSTDSQTVPPLPAPVVSQATPSLPVAQKNKRWAAANILQIAPDASRLWQFDAKGGNFILSREQKTANDAPLPVRFIGKTWSSLWQPKLNVAWLPPENVFLRVVELPKSNFDETVSMVELQLEKISPMPVGQIVWTIHSLPSASPDLQSVVVVIANRNAVEEFLGKLEGRGFLADRLEAPMLDQLAATPAAGDGAWIYAGARGTNSGLVAWWSGGMLRNLSFIVLPTEGDSAKSLSEQLTQLAWAGDMEGWLTAQPQWHLVADPLTAAHWEPLLRAALNEPVEVTHPLQSADLAAHTARRAAAAMGTGLLPLEFSARYRQQFHDRLWLHGLYTAGVLYLIFVAIYFAATTVLNYKTTGVEQQVRALGNSYTNVMQLQAEYHVLQERDQLKYAALDCWKIVAEKLPETITLQHFAFSGDKLMLSGTAPQDQFNELLNFNSEMKKATGADGKPMFNGGEDVNPRIAGDNLNWMFTLQLANAEAAGGAR
jgi:hypothetical protein